MPDALLEVSVTLPPSQNVVGVVVVMVGVDWAGLMVTAMAFDAMLEQLPLVTTAVYEPAAVAVKVCAVAPEIGLPLRYH